MVVWAATLAAGRLSQSHLGGFEYTQIVAVKMYDSCKIGCCSYLAN
jgi:hypothetical protein